MRPNSNCLSALCLIACYASKRSIRHAEKERIYINSSFFKNGAAAFDRSGNGCKDSHANKLERQNAQLKAKLSSKDEVIAEIMASHIELNKVLGRFKSFLGRIGHKVLSD